MDRGAWGAIVHEVTKESDMTASTHVCDFNPPRQAYYIYFFIYFY